MLTFLGIWQIISTFYKLLGKWFQSHGESSLIMDPKPPLVTMLENNPYDDPTNPPLEPDEITGYCAMQWQEDEIDPETGKKMYKLANFSTELEAIESGWNITHKGHCGACSILQDLGVYVKQNLTEDTRQCGLEGIFLGTWYTCYFFIYIIIQFANIFTRSTTCFQLPQKHWFF